MEIKIYTYADPYYLQSESYWKDIKNCPHFCVSQTMVNGLKKAVPSLKKAGYLTTVNGLINTIYENWNNINTRVRQIIEADNAVNRLNISETGIRRSLEFNAESIAKCIRLFKELELSPDSFDVSQMNSVQKYIIDIYRIISQREHSSFDFKRINDEDDIHNGIINALKKNGNEPRLSEMNTDTIVIHGIHQFSPAILCAIEDISVYKNVVLLFNYQNQYSRIYQTWIDIYSLFHRKIEYSVCNEFKPSELQYRSYPCNVLADRIGSLCEGRIGGEPGALNKLEVIEFENLTEFAGYCADLFETAKIKCIRESKGRAPVLNYMTEQMYSASGKVNDILRAYFPEQFEDRPFLDYPIGRFFAAVTEMWDNENKRVKVNELSLIKDCLRSGILSEKSQGRLLNTFNAVESYVKDENTIYGIVKRLERLGEHIGSGDKSLERISYFNCPKQDIDELAQALEELNKIIYHFFEDFSRGGDNFNRFYEKISIFINNILEQTDPLDAEMREVLSKLSERIENIDLPDTVTFTCLKQTLSFYLSQDDSLVNSANWIVRDFEQIDGDILRSKYQDNKSVCYHFCCLSDKDICAVKDEKLPWPLDIRFFEYANEPLSLNYRIFIRSKSEYKNFKRYALLYGLEFNRTACKLSYVKAENGKNNDLFHLIKILGIKVTKYKNDGYKDYVQRGCYTAENPEIMSDFSWIDREKYAICPYWFALESLVQGKTVFRDRFTIIFYLGVLLQRKIELEHEGENLTDESLQKIIGDTYQSIDGDLHIANEYEKTQIISRTYSYLRRNIKNGYMPTLNDNYKIVLERKQDILHWNKKTLENVPSEDEIKNIVSQKKFYRYKAGLNCRFCSCKDICLKV